jgi:hypothetical protein
VCICIPKPVSSFRFCYICNVVWTRLTAVLFLISFPSSFSRTVACVYNLLVLLFSSSFLVFVSSYSTTHFLSLSVFLFLLLSPVQQSAIPHIVLSSLHLSLSFALSLSLIFFLSLSCPLSLPFLISLSIFYPSRPSFPLSSFRSYSLPSSLDNLY